jgi:hypothetical protein
VKDLQGQRCRARWDETHRSHTGDRPDVVVEDLHPYPTVATGAVSYHPDQCRDDCSWDDAADDL